MLFEEGSPLSKITTLRPKDYSEARTIGERFRDGTPVIMDLVSMDNADAKRLVDFAAGLAFALRGSFDKVATKVFLLSPADVDVTRRGAPAHRRDRLLRLPVGDAAGVRGRPQHAGRLAASRWRRHARRAARACIERHIVSSEVGLSVGAVLRRSWASRCSSSGCCSSPGSSSSSSARSAGTGIRGASPW